MKQASIMRRQHHITKDEGRPRRLQLQDVQPASYITVHAVQIACSCMQSGRCSPSGVASMGKPPRRPASACHQQSSGPTVPVALCSPAPHGAAPKCAPAVPLRMVQLQTSQLQPCLTPRSSCKSTQCKRLISAAYNACWTGRQIL